VAARHTLVTTPLGPLGVAWRGRCLTGIDLAPAAASGGPPAAAAPAWLLAELDAYFADPAHRFGCALAQPGTAFQRRVWALIAAIPAGRTRTYGALAAELGSAARAVGNACRANPLPLAVPCHRVVGARGLGGFAGDTGGRLLAVKRWLLRHEGALPPPRAAGGGAS
jgi:methylated-DNA-[protein]-cysteine S-methyltransferase